MVPFDALGQMGGDALSGGVPPDQRGNVATSIAEQASTDDADAPPPARVEFLYLAGGPCGGISSTAADSSRRAAHADLYCSSRRTIAAPSTIAFIFPNATSRGRYFSPQSGATTIFSAGT